MIWKVKTLDGRPLMQQQLARFVRLLVVPHLLLVDYGREGTTIIASALESLVLDGLSWSIWYASNASVLYEIILRLKLRARTMQQRKDFVSGENNRPRWNEPAQLDRKRQLGALAREAYCTLCQTN